MILKSIALKKLALKTAFSKSYITVRTSLSPAYQSAKKQAEKAKEYAPSPVGFSLYAGGLFAPGRIGKGLYRASQFYGGVEIPIRVLKIIQKAYQSEHFYKASWKIKSKILANNIVRDPTIQRNIGEAALSAIIYQIIKRHKNKQGNEDLATAIAVEAGLTIQEE